MSYKSLCTIAVFSFATLFCQPFLIANPHGPKFITVEIDYENENGESVHFKFKVPCTSDSSPNDENDMSESDKDCSEALPFSNLPEEAATNKNITEGIKEATKSNVPKKTEQHNIIQRKSNDTAPSAPQTPASVGSNPDIDPTRQPTSLEDKTTNHDAFFSDDLKFIIEKIIMALLIVFLGKKWQPR